VSHQQYNVRVRKIADRTSWWTHPSSRRLHSAPVAVTRARTSSWIMPRMLYINCSGPTSRSGTLGKQEWEETREREREIGRGRVKERGRESKWMRERKRRRKTKKRFIGQEGRRDSAGTHTRTSGTSETPERRKYAPRFIRGFSRRGFSNEQTITRKFAFLGRLQSSCVPEIRQSSRLIRVNRAAK